MIVYFFYFYFMAEKYRPLRLPWDLRKRQLSRKIRNLRILSKEKYYDLSHVVKSLHELLGLSDTSSVLHSSDSLSLDNRSRKSSKTYQRLQCSSLSSTSHDPAKTWKTEKSASYPSCTSSETKYATAKTSSSSKTYSRPERIRTGITHIINTPMYVLGGLAMLSLEYVSDKVQHLRIRRR